METSSLGVVFLLSQELDDDTCTVTQLVFTSQTIDEDMALCIQRAARDCEETLLKATVDIKQSKREFKLHFHPDVVEVTIPTLIEKYFFPALEDALVRRRSYLQTGPQVAVHSSVRPFGHYGG